MALKWKNRAFSLTWLVAMQKSQNKEILTEGRSSTATGLVWTHQYGYRLITCFETPKINMSKQDKR